MSWLRPLILCYVLAALQLVFETRLAAQDSVEKSFTRYTKQEGLSHDYITGMVQDSIGYIWISTYSGLNRFDGSRFVQFHSGDDSLSLPNEFLYGLTWLDNHRFATGPGGLHIVDTRTGQTRNLFVPYSDRQYQFKFNSILVISGNSEGDIFVLTRSGFYHFDKDLHLAFRFDYYPKEQVPDTTFGFGRYLLRLNDQELIVASIGGMYYYNKAGHQFHKMTAADCPIMADFLNYPEHDYEFFEQRPGSIIALDPVTDSLIFIRIAAKQRSSVRLPAHFVLDEFDWHSSLSSFDDSTAYITGKASGFFKIKLGSGPGQLVFNKVKCFPFYSCRSLLEDRDHNLWIGTNKGVLRQDSRLSKIVQVSPPPAVDALYPGTIDDQTYAAGDKLYTATRGGAGLLVYEKEPYLRYSRRIGLEKFGKPAATINAIAPINDSSVLLATNGPLLKVNLITGAQEEIKPEKWTIPGDWAADLYRDRNNNVWIVSEKIYRYDIRARTITYIPPGPKPFDRVVDASCITEDTAGNIWIGGHGLIRYNTATGRYDRRVDSFPYIKMPDKEINSVVGDSQGNLWINCNNNGLACYNIERGSFRHFTRESGLPDNNIANMIVIGNKLWMATFSGIACLDLRTYRITRFGVEEGFPDLPITHYDKFYFDEARNKLYIGFGGSIVQFDPDIIFQKSQAPSLFIESLTSGDQKKFLFPCSDVTSSWLRNEITLTIGSINFFTGNSQRFAYRILKDDSSIWQQLGTQNTFSISSLAPGLHRIQVRLSSANNRWPEQVKEIDITILPPFWQKPWFVALTVMVLLVSVYWLLKWRTGLIRKKEQAKTHIEKLKAEEYKNQFELEQISNYFSSSLADKKSVEEVLWDVSRNLIGRMKYVDCMIYMWNEDHTKMVQKASYGPKGTPKAILENEFTVASGQGIVGYVMETREPLLVPDTRVDTRYRVDDVARLSEICVPIIHNNELVGIIDAEHPLENYYRERDLQILTTIATLVGNKIKQIESEHHLRIKQEEISFINQQLAEAQLSALQAQMNPHFIFNALNSIKGMILDNEQQKASRYLSKFAHMIRMTLNQSKETFTTLHENIEYLQTYLLMEKLRFDDSFSFRITLDEDIDKEETLIPTLMIQPLTENAIWHGLMPKEGIKKLSIRFSQQDETISCTIRDNGIGIRKSEELKQRKTASHRSVGLSNLRNRIKIMNEKYDTGCSLEIVDLEDPHNKDKTGTCAVLRFKVITNKPNA
jgi:ligand-binding sensor domain-containing protein/putative methionine-R-sulfoxide reductase with GAF domain